jgi:hypothetical protein
MSFYVVIFLLTGLSGDKVISALVKEGFQVGPASTNHKCITENKDWPVAQMLLKVVATDPNITDTTQVRGIIETLLIKNDTKYYSIVITRLTEMCLGYTNIKLSDIQKRKMEKIQKASHLKLVPSTLPDNKDISDKNPE